MRQVCAVVIDGDLERPVLVQLDLFPVTAQRKFDNEFVVSSSRYYSPSITIDALHFPQLVKTTPCSRMSLYSIRTTKDQFVMM